MASSLVRGARLLPIECSAGSIRVLHGLWIVDLRFNSITMPSDMSVHGLLLLHVSLDACHTQLNARWPAKRGGDPEVSSF